MTTIPCPQTWDGVQAIDFVNSLEAVGTTDMLVIDFSTTQFVKPFGTLIIANGLRRLFKIRKQNSLKLGARIPKGDTGACSYLRHIGFFEYVGLSAGNHPGEARGGSTYVPIRTIAQADLQSVSGKGVLQQGVEAVSEQLATVIYPRLSEQIMMQYCLREVIRNVFEHAETDSCTVFAQRYSDGRAEIAIIDEGIGIYTSLSRTIPVNNVDEALRLSMKPGITRVTQPISTGKWENSGFGLYVLSELGRSLGEFLLATNGRYGCMNSQAPNPEFGDLMLNGTSVKLLVNLDQADYFPNRLKSIVDRGELEYFRDHGVIKSASKGSKSTRVP